MPIDLSTEAMEEVSQDKVDENAPSQEIGENQCHLYMMKLTNRSDLLELFGSEHVHLYTLMNSRTTTRTMVIWCLTCPLLAFLSIVLSSLDPML